LFENVTQVATRRREGLKAGLRLPLSLPNLHVFLKLFFSSFLIPCQLNFSSAAFLVS
jgi:hypothetical protein